MVKIVMKVSLRELEIIRAFRKIEHGQLLDVEIEEDKLVIDAEVYPITVNFLKTVRDGIRHFDTIVVFNSEPSSATSSGQTRSGIRFIKKYKFS